MPFPQVDSLDLIRCAQHPRCGVQIVRVTATLFFANSLAFKEKLVKIMDRAGKQLAFLIIDSSGSGNIDLQVRHHHKISRMQQFSLGGS
jgi:MFS superfamily sulfate permease-like transporter